MILVFEHTATHGGDPDEISGSLLLPSSALTQSEPADEISLYSSVIHLSLSPVNVLFK